MRKVQSMHELAKSDQEETWQPAPTQTQPPLRMADKIDNFLDKVSKQQDALAKMLEERRVGRSSVSKLSSMGGSNLQRSKRSSNFQGKLQQPRQSMNPVAPKPNKIIAALMKSFMLFVLIKTFFLLVIVVLIYLVLIGTS